MNEKYNFIVLTTRDNAQRYFYKNTGLTANSNINRQALENLSVILPFIEKHETINTINKEKKQPNGWLFEGIAVLS